MDKPSTHKLEKKREGKMDNGKKKNTFLMHLTFIIFLYIAGIVIVYGIYMMSPGYYNAKVSVIKPAEIPAAGEVLQEEDSPETETDTELVLAVLNSRKMKNDIIEKFGLLSAYKAKDEQEAVKILERRTTIDAKKGAIIELNFQDTQPERTAAIANFYVENLKAFIEETRAGNLYAREYEWVEKRLLEINGRISSLDEEIAGLQNEYAIIVDKDLSQLTRLTGRLAEELYLKKADLQKNPERADLKRDIGEIKKTLSELSVLKGKLVAVNRELGVQENLYNYFTSRMEEVKRNEVLNRPVVQVLDTAGVPERINKPDFKIFLLINTIIVGIIAVIIFFFDLLKYLGSI